MTWKVGDKIKYKATKTAKWRKGKIRKKLSAGKYELVGGKIVYEKDPDAIKENAMKLTKQKLKEIIKEELKLAEQISSFHTIQRNLIDFGFGNMVVSWRGTKKKVKDFKPGNRIDNITLEKTHNTLLKNKSMRYDGNDYHVTTQGKKYFKGTLQLEGKLKEEIFNEQINPQVTKAVDRFIKTMAKKYGYSDQDAVYAIMQVLTKAGYKGVR
jgi:hypothetical protein